MFYTADQLVRAAKVLDSATPCPAPRTKAGQATWTRPPKMTAKSERGRNPEVIAYGRHGRAFLQVDPETGVVRCGLCARAVEDPLEKVGE